MTAQDTKTNSVLFDVDTRGIATVTLNNPEKHNAFDDVIINRLLELFTNISQRNDIHVVVLASSGKSFSAGGDLAWMKRMATYSYEENQQDAQILANMFKALNFLPQPTIAKIQGAAFGGAVGLASCCDIVIASDKASFCLSEVKVGLAPATISPYVVSAIGLRACRRYFLTAERFFADQAKQLGLVSEVVPLDKLSSCVDNMANILLANAPKAVRVAKQLAFDVQSFNAQSSGKNKQEANQVIINETCELIAKMRVSEEGQEGLTAFFEKRSPQWQIQSNDSSKG